MAKTISQIKNEISNFYLSIQNEITDVSTGSVAGGIIYALAVALKDIYDNLDGLERQAFIATAEGRYLDLLIEGGFFLQRPSSTRSTGYVLVYGDDAIVNPSVVGNGLVCAEYDANTDTFLSEISSATKFTGTNSVGSNSVSYVLTPPKNSLFVRKDVNGRTVIDLRGKRAKYLLLPVASVLRGTQTNLTEGALNTFSNPPSGLRYVSNVNNPAEIIFNFSGVSTAPLYSRNTTLLSYSALNTRLRVVNAFNFSSKGFLEISYRSDFPTRLIRGVYRSNLNDEITSGIVFQYDSKTQTNISLTENASYVIQFKDNVLTRYDLVNFFYNNIRYFKGTTGWGADTNTTLADGTEIGPETFVAEDLFFAKFFLTDPWVIQQTREQVSEDVVFDPDNVLTETYSIRDGFRLSAARDRLNDDQYRRYFNKYINSLPRGTNSALEFAALQVPGITFAKTVPSEDLPVGTAVLLASSENGQLSADRKQAVYDALKDEWVSAGVDLFVKAPDLIEFTISVSVRLEDIVFENSVKDAINVSISNYLQTKEPGDTIKYGEIYSIVSNIVGVRGVSELVIGRINPKHYTDYAGNYVKTAVEKLVEYKPSEYFIIEEPTFRELRNEIVMSSDINGVSFTPLSFPEFLDTLDPTYIFSSNNRNEENEAVTYAAVRGIFSSDGGQLVAAASDYAFTAYSNLDINVDNKILGIRFSVFSSDTTNPAVLISVNGASPIISSDSGEIKTIFTNVANGSSDVQIVFSSSDFVFIEDIQMFLHGDRFDTHLIGDYKGLRELTFINNDKILYIYGISAPNPRYRKLKMVGYTEEDYPGRLDSIFNSLVKAESITSFQTIIKDFQYGLNTFGENSQQFEDSFSDISKSNDPFTHFFVYSSTAPFADSLSSSYPVNPESVKNNEISDYTLGARQIFRFGRATVNPRVGLIPLIGIRII